MYASHHMTAGYTPHYSGGRYGSSSASVRNVADLLPMWTDKRIQRQMYWTANAN
jgi:hypothetical protein